MKNEKSEENENTANIQKKKGLSLWSKGDKKASKTIATVLSSIRTECSTHKGHFQAISIIALLLQR